MVTPDSHLANPTLSALSDVGCSCGYDTKATLGTAQEPVNLGIRKRAIGIALLVGHGSEYRSVPQSRPGAREGELISGYCHTLT